MNGQKGSLSMKKSDRCFPYYKEWLTAVSGSQPSLPRICCGDHGSSGWKDKYLIDYRRTTQRAR
jgi:hypothetical protein